MDIGDPWLSGERPGPAAACRERGRVAKAPDYSGAAQALQIVRGDPPVAAGLD
jgi:hypothetical protein